jgi:hypothetical protein
MESSTPGASRIVGSLNHLVIIAFTLLEQAPGFRSRADDLLVKALAAINFNPQAGIESRSGGEALGIRVEDDPSQAVLSEGAKSYLHEGASQTLAPIGGSHEQAAHPTSILALNQFSVA